MSDRPFVVLSVLLAIFCVSAGQLSAQTREEFDRARQDMVSQFIQKEGIKNPRVLDAMRRVPRHDFVPLMIRPKAYFDTAWSIGYKQTISAPFIVAYMTEALDPQPTDRLLEVGTGSGYQAAILSLLVKEVYSIEIVEPLGRMAERRLKRLGYGNVKTKVGDGYLGWPEDAPFDKIIVTCSPEDVPKPLVDQLREGGRMIIPLGERFHQDIYLLEKEHGKLVRKQLRPTLFVPMTGRSAQERIVRPDPFNPQINNGGFEQREAGGEPAVWYYDRQLSLVEEGAPEGRLCARFDNQDRGRAAQALQGMAIDGRTIGSLRFTLKVRAERIVDGPESFNRADLQVNFYDITRRPIGSAIAARWVGTFDWRDVTGSVQVPAAAREAIVRIGLNGATGRLYADAIKMTSERRGR
jgi:protein-L-isoaspartate(D-aspartate) O-methyltransferase